MGLQRSVYSNAVGGEGIEDKGTGVVVVAWVVARFCKMFCNRWLGRRSRGWRNSVRIDGKSGEGGRFGSGSGGGIGPGGVFGHVGECARGRKAATEGVGGGCQRKRRRFALGVIADESLRPICLTPTVHRFKPHSGRTRSGRPMRFFVVFFCCYSLYF